MPKPPYNAFRHRLILSSTLLLVVLAALVAWKIASDAQSNRDGALAQTQSFARAIGAHMESVTRVIDLSLIRSSEALGALDASSLRDPARVHRVLAVSANAMDATYWVHFVDAGGVGVSASTSLPVRGVSYADRAYFKAQRAGQIGRLYVSPPEVGRASKRRVFFVSRGVFAPNGEFLGVVVASVDAASIANVFANASFQPTLSITLMHGDGLIVARSPLFEKSFATSLVSSELYRRSKTSRRGSYEAISSVDGQRRVFSFQTVGDTGLVVAVGIALDSWTRSLPRDISVALAALSVVVLALVLSGRFALRSFLRIERGQAEQERLNQELITAANARARGEKRMRMIADSLPALVAYIGKDRRYVFHNLFYETLLGPRARDVVGQAMWEVLGETVYAGIHGYVDAVLNGERVSFEQRIVVNAEERWFKFEYTPEVDESDAVIGFYTMGIDITETKHTQDRLRASARTDALTGLPNRAKIHERLAEALARSRRHESKTACLFLDVDHFKSINDTLGHSGGDQALIEFGRRLRSVARETDLVGRLAGDEFVIVMEGVNQPAAAHAVARKIIAAMRTPFVIEGHERLLSTSVGVAVSNGRGEDAEAVLKRADEALYEAKRAGRGGFATSL